MKKRKIGISFNYRSCDAFAEYLHEQSLRGWHFKEFRLGMVFEQGDPADIDYTVEVFPNGTEMDTRPEASTEEYAEYCEAAGWKLIDSSRKFCVFRRTREDAAPIVEPAERFANIRKAEWLLWLSGAVPVFLLTAIYLAQLFTLNFNRWIFSNLMLLVLLFMSLSSLERISEGILLLHWSVTRDRMLKEGTVPIYGKRSLWPFKTALFPILFLIAAIFLSYYQKEYSPLYVIPILTLIPLLIVTALISFLRPSRNDNWIYQMAAGICIFFYLTVILTAVVLGAASGSETASDHVKDFPLVQADYRQMDGMIISGNADRMKSVLGSASHFYVTYDTEASETSSTYSEDTSDNLQYTIYQSPHSWILDRLWKDEMPRQKDLPEDRTREWDAVSAVRRINGSNIYCELIRYTDRIWIISSDERLEDDQVRVIHEKLEHVSY